MALWKNILLASAITAWTLWTLNANTVDDANKRDVSSFISENVRDKTKNDLLNIVNLPSNYNINNKERKINDWNNLEFDQKFTFENRQFTPAEFWTVNSENIQKIRLNDWNFEKATEYLGWNSIPKFSKVLSNKNKPKYKKIIENTMSLYNEWLENWKPLSKSLANNLLESSFKLAFDMIGSGWKKIWCSEAWAEYATITWNHSTIAKYWYSKDWSNYQLKDNDVQQIISAPGLQFKNGKPLAKDLVDTCTSSKVNAMSVIWQDMSKEMDDYLKAKNLNKSLNTKMATLDNQLQKLNSLKKTSLSNSEKEEIQDLIMYSTINTEAVLDTYQTTWNQADVHKSAKLLYAMMSTPEMLEQTSDYYKNYQRTVWNKYEQSFPSNANKIKRGQ